jgi:acetylornithine deacetylase/succinyl-diaminopimelate desuccinylase-like protein
MAVSGMLAVPARNRAVADLVQFLRFPSISADPQRSSDLRRCGVWLAAFLRRIGLRHVEMIETSRHPSVYGEWLGTTRRADASDLRAL